MNKLAITIALIIAIALVGSPVFANGDDSHAPLPNPGLTPESPFYFLDRLGETIRSIFAFSPEAKARVQIKFAAERIAEINIILENKGVEAKGLDVAQARLASHIANASNILTSEKNKGKEVSALAKEINDDFKSSKSTLIGKFKEEKRKLEAREEELENELKAAVQTGDVALQEQIAAELGRVKGQLELIEARKDALEEELEKDEEKIEEALEAEEKARKAIREAEEEKEEVLEEAAEEGVELPANTFARFDNFLAQAKSAFEAGDLESARALAKRAEDTLEEVEDLIDALEEAREEEGEELEEELEKEEGAREKEKEDLEKQLEGLDKEIEKELEGVEKELEDLETEEPEAKKQSYAIEADDNGFYLGGENLDILDVNKGEVEIVFNVLSKSTYFGGLDFRGCGKESQQVNPGGSVKLEYNFQENCTITSYWPASGVKKDSLEIKVN